MDRYFRNAYQYEWRNIGELRGLQLVQNGHNAQTIRFATPTLWCRGGSPFVDLFECNVLTTVTRVTLRRQNVDEQGQLARYEEVSNSATVFATFNSGALIIPNADNAIYTASGGEARLRAVVTATDEVSSALSAVPVSCCPIDGTIACKRLLFLKRYLSKRTYGRCYYK
jgi:hypothetical protein